MIVLLSPISSSPSPLEFIKDLEGCHKEDKVKGIHKLRKYLQDDDDDDFDDLVDSAIKAIRKLKDISLSTLVWYYLLWT